MKPAAWLRVGRAVGEGLVFLFGMGVFLAFVWLITP